MKQRQVLSQINSTWPVSMQMDSYGRINTPLQPLTNPQSCITALYAKNNQVIGEHCPLSISHAPHTFIPVAVTVKPLDHSLKL